jgi:hypothetical protein
MVDYFIRRSKRNHNSQSKTKSFYWNLGSHIYCVLPKSDYGNINQFWTMWKASLLEKTCACTCLQKSLFYLHRTSRCKQMCSRYESLKDAKI